MAKYDVTYTCGHTGRIDVTGKNKDRAWRIGVEESKLCPDCWKVQRDADRAKENQDATAANVAAGFPQLEGTEKQIPWAESIRKNIIEAVQKEIFGRIDPEKRDVHPEKYAILAVGFEHLKSHSAASWWIDNRGIGMGINSLLDLLEKEHAAAEKAAAEPPAEIVAAASAEATIYPEKTVSSLVAEFTIQENVITISYPARDETFREVVKSLGYQWKDGWQRTIGPYNGSIQDRVAEAGNRLLAAGFPIRIYNAEIRAMAISGEYDPEPVRWVKCRTEGTYKGWFAITWPYSQNNFYDRAKKLPGAKWSNQNMVVPPESYREVIDFAEMYKFSLSDMAKGIVQTAKANREASLTTGVKRPAKDAPPEPGKKPVKLDIPQEVVVDDEFRDDDQSSSLPGGCS